MAGTELVKACYEVDYTARGSGPRYLSVPPACPGKSCWCGEVNVETRGGPPAAPLTHSSPQWTPWPR